MKTFNLSMNEFDLMYILNCVSLTRNLLYQGNNETCFHYFNKENYIDHNYNLYLLQMRLILEGNKTLYNSKRYDMSWAQIIYFRENKNLNCFSTNRKDHYKEIFEFEKNINKWKNNVNVKENKNSYLKNFWLFKKIS